MLQDTTIISSYSIEKAWPGCYTALGEVESFSRPAAPYFIDNAANFSLILVIIIFFLFSYERILEGAYYIVTSFMSLKKMLIIEDQYNIQVSRNTLFLYSVVVTSFIIANHSGDIKIPGNTYPVIIKFLIILAGFGGYLLFKKIFFSMLSWINRNGIFTTINKLFYSYTELWILLSLAGIIVNAVFFDADLSLMAFYVSLTAFFSFILYFIRGYQLIITNGFSHFFYILYLCTLEFLPVVILAHLIFR